MSSYKNYKIHKIKSAYRKHEIINKKCGQLMDRTFNVI